jgi:ubiquinone biosynthesis monooxygenase Coq7
MTHQTTLDLPKFVISDLRTDHAGETGAIFIYKGILLITKDPALREFASRHLETEISHLQQIEKWLPKSGRSLLLPVWRLAGFLTGALPALFGSNSVYATIEAVETFVDTHYAEQVSSLERYSLLNDLRETLLKCQSDEVEHRNEAATRKGAKPLSFILQVWCLVVGIGSRSAVSICRYL